MTDSSTGPALSAAEIRAAEALLTRAWGERADVRAVETILDRGHVFRLRLAAGRSAVLKRRGEHADDRQSRGFGVDLAALEFLSAMPDPVAPRLLGADDEAGLFVMEDLGSGVTLADSLLTADRAQAEADLVAYARALGSMHAWSMGRLGELAALRARHTPGREPVSAWPNILARDTERFVTMATTLGLATGGVADEIAELGSMLADPRYQALVHGDACPDNVVLVDGACRIFDFERAGWGLVTLDAAYLRAPFPSCWCFASLPADAAAPALDAYRACLEATGADLGPDWDAAMVAALGCWAVVRGGATAKVLDADREWGTTTMRPRLVVWLGSFSDAAAAAGLLPRLRAVAEALRDLLLNSGPDLLLPDYPAFARPGSAVVQVPPEWRPVRARR
jgi:Ser/Thr protein kinase RdoA (MazF antagonist)